MMLAANPDESWRPGHVGFIPLQRYPTAPTTPKKRMNGKKNKTMEIQNMLECFMPQITYQKTKIQKNFSRFFMGTYFFTVYNVLQERPLDFFKE